MVVESCRVPFTIATNVEEDSFFCISLYRLYGYLEHRETDWTLQMSDTMIILHCCIMLRLLVQAESTVENFNLLFMQAEATHALVAISTHVHFISNELPRASTLVMDEWRFECCQLVHYEF